MPTIGLDNYELDYDSTNDLAVIRHRGTGNEFTIDKGTVSIGDTDHAAADHAAGSSLEISLGQLANVDPGERNLLPEGAQTGLVADATGVQYEGQMRQVVASALLDSNRSVYIEAATNSSAGDESVAVEIYDDTAAAVADSLTISGGSPRARSADISGSLTSGNEVHVRYNVTTASGTSGATFDAIGTRLIVE